MYIPERQTPPPEKMCTVLKVVQKCVEWSLVCFQGLAQNDSSVFAVKCLAKLPSIHTSRMCLMRRETQKKILVWVLPMLAQPFIRKKEI